MLNAFFVLLGKWEQFNAFFVLFFEYDASAQWQCEKEAAAPFPPSFSLSLSVFLFGSLPRSCHGEQICRRAARPALMAFQLQKGHQNVASEDSSGADAYRR